MKRAFTLIELIITMVILGIVAYIASGLIAKTYIASSQTTALNRLNMKVENAITEIANRLEYAINDTIIKRKSANDSSLMPVFSADDNYEVLEWIGMDKDGFDAGFWNGFVDLKNSTSSNLAIPDANLTALNYLIERLAGTSSGLNSSNIAIFFPETYNYTNVGYNGVSNGVSIVNSYISASKIFNFTLNSDKVIKEHYKLSYSAYSVVPVNCKNGVCDLELRYNYRPWKGQQYNNINTNKSLLANNVTVFKTYVPNNRIHIKLCMQDKYLGDKTISLCKERVVIK